MKKIFKKVFKKYVSWSFLSNRYVFVLLFFATWILLLDDASYIRHRALNKKIRELEENKKYYQTEIIKDKKQIKELNDIEKIERYARENYYMKKPNEDVYIIEYKNNKER